MRPRGRGSGQVPGAPAHLPARTQVSSSHLPGPRARGEDVFPGELGAEPRHGECARPGPRPGVGGSIRPEPAPCGRGPGVPVPGAPDPSLRLRAREWGMLGTRSPGFPPTSGGGRGVWGHLSGALGSGWGDPLTDHWPQVTAPGRDVADSGLDLGLRGEAVPAPGFPCGGLVRPPAKRHALPSTPAAGPGSAPFVRGCSAGALPRACLVRPPPPPVDVFTYRNLGVLADVKQKNKKMSHVPFVKRSLEVRPRV